MTKVVEKSTALRMLPFKATSRHIASGIASEVRETAANKFYSSGENVQEPTTGPCAVATVSSIELNAAGTGVLLARRDLSQA